VAANFKSHVLRRDEKGFFGVPFKRLLLAGVGGGLTYTIVNLALRQWSIPAAVIVAIAIVVLTGPRGGLPLWERLLYRLRGSLLLAAARQPRSLIAQLTHTLDLPLDLVRLDGAQVFAPPTPNVEVDLREWITFATAPDADHDDGLVFVDSPLRNEP
jgi:hypothetical protein